MHLLTWDGNVVLLALELCPSGTAMPCLDVQSKVEKLHPWMFAQIGAFGSSAQSTEVFIWVLWHMTSAALDSFLFH